MALKSQQCTECGAPLEKESLECTYCGTWFTNIETTTSTKSNKAIKTPTIFTLPPGIGEFGISNKSIWKVSVLIVLSLYTTGWMFEDTQYWLDETAMSIWIGVIPFILLIVALLWQTNRAVLYKGLLLSIFIFIAHIVIMLIYRGRLWDDHIGIAAMVATFPLLGWSIGRLLHAVIRLRTIQS